MQLVTLSCNNCGAPIDAPEGANYLTCEHCGSRLVVRHSDNAIYTEVLGKIDERTAQMAEDLEAIKTESEIAEVDREWQIEQEKHLTRDEDGWTGLPTTGRLVGVVIGAVLVIIFVLVWMSTGMSIFNNSPVGSGGLSGELSPGGAGSGPADLFGLVGTLMIVAVIVGVVVMFYRKSKYDEAEAEYRSKRNSVARRLKK